MRFSIIVPIYNVELYLPECIESVINQNFRDFELILVNDGSPDECMYICHAYAHKDSRIVVINQKNGGLSHARNAGLEIASGEYIIFLDGDDFLVPLILETIDRVLVTQSAPDVLMCAHIDLFGHADEHTVPLELSPQNIVVDRNHVYNEFWRMQGCYWSAWMNILRRENLKEKNLMFKVGLIGAEDCDFFMRVVRVSNSFLFLNAPLIYYRRNRTGSITNCMHFDAIIGQLEIFSKNYYIYASKEQENIKMKKYFSFKFLNTITLIERLNNSEEINICVEFIKNNKKILASAKNLKYIVARTIWSCFGYSFGTKILKAIKYVMGDK